MRQPTNFTTDFPQLSFSQQLKHGQVQTVDLPRYQDEFYIPGEDGSFYGKIAGDRLYVCRRGLDDLPDLSLDELIKAFKPVLLQDRDERMINVHIDRKTADTAPRSFFEPDIFKLENFPRLTFALCDRFRRGPDQERLYNYIMGKTETGVYEQFPEWKTNMARLRYDAEPLGVLFCPFNTDFEVENALHDLYFRTPSGLDLYPFGAGSSLGLLWMTVEELDELEPNIEAHVPYYRVMLFMDLCKDFLWKMRKWAHKDIFRLVSYTYAKKGKQVLLGEKIAEHGAHYTHDETLLQLAQILGYDLPKAA